MYPKRIVTLAYLLLAGLTYGQVKTPDCGGEGERACGFFEAEFWANSSGFCDVAAESR